MPLPQDPKMLLETLGGPQSLRGESATVQDAPKAAGVQQPIMSAIR